MSTPARSGDGTLMSEASYGSVFAFCSIAFRLAFCASILARSSGDTLFAVWIVGDIRPLSQSRPISFPNDSRNTTAAGSCSRGKGSGSPRSLFEPVPHVHLPVHCRRDAEPVERLAGPVGFSVEPSEAEVAARGERAHADA